MDKIELASAIDFAADGKTPTVSKWTMPPPLPNYADGRAPDGVSPSPTEADANAVWAPSLCLHLNAMLGWILKHLPIPTKTRR